MFDKNTIRKVREISIQYMQQKPNLLRYFPACTLNIYLKPHIGFIFTTVNMIKKFKPIHLYKIIKYIF